MSGTNNVITASHCVTFRQVQLLHHNTNTFPKSFTLEYFHCSFYLYHIRHKDRPPATYHSRHTVILLLLLFCNPKQQKLGFRQNLIVYYILVKQPANKLLTRHICSVRKNPSKHQANLCHHGQYRLRLLEQVAPLLRTFSLSSQTVHTALTRIGGATSLLPNCSSNRLHSTKTAHDSTWTALQLHLTAALDCT